MKKIIIAGGTGSLGKVLSEHFLNKGYSVVILSRTVKPVKNNVTYAVWDANTQGEWTKEFEGAEVIINLTGKSVNCRYTEENKKEIIASRVNSTLAIGKAISMCKTPPKVWLNASSAAIYGDTDEKLTNENSSYGNGFSPDVCKQWESAFYKHETPHTRKIAMRIGLVLTVNGGVLEPLFNLAKYWLVGTIGNGNQYMTWIHETDFLNVVELFLTDDSINGGVNIASPNPVNNKGFMRAIRNAYGVPLNLPAPAFGVKIASWFMNTEAELVLKGRRVVSEILNRKNHIFQYPAIKEAMRDIISKKRNNTNSHEALSHS